MTLQIFLHFFHHKFVTSLQSTSLPPATSAPAYGASEMRYSPRPDHALRTSSPIAVVEEPDRALRTSSPIAVVAEPDRASGHVFSYPPTASGVHAPPSLRRGRAADDALLPYIFSGTALRCISPSPLYPRTRCPGLTENGSALRTTPPHSRSSASPKRIGMDIRHTPTHSPLTLRVSGVTENSAFPTRLRLSPSALTL